MTTSPMKTSNEQGCIFVERQSEDRLTLERWVFRFFTTYTGKDFIIRLDFYSVHTRTRPRGVFRKAATKAWKRNGRIWECLSVPACAVPIPDGLESAVRDEAISILNAAPFILPTEDSPR